MSDDKATTSKKNSKHEDETEEEDDTTMEAIRKFFAERLRFTGGAEDESSPAKKVIEDLSFEGLTQHWKAKGFKNIITMVGAGISTSAGIPDFRSPGSGLYDNLQKYNLPHPSAIFEMDYFRENPQPFFALAKELYPGTFNPTISHYFVRLLHEKGLLLRHYTQNIDTLERVANIPDEKLVEAHGSFFTNHCLDCRKLYSMQWMKDQIFSDNVPTCEACNGVVKPDIVFFGENLPEKFYTLADKDFAKCDLLIIMGTSLEVQPFASLVDRVKPSCLRLLINRVKAGQGHGFSLFMFGSAGLQYDSPKNTRDIAFIGDCDDGVSALVEALGWKDELDKLVKKEIGKLPKTQDSKDKTNEGASTSRKAKIDNQKEPTDEKELASKDKTSSDDKDKEDQDKAGKL